jgi:hypothetical protein
MSDATLSGPAPIRPPTRTLQSISLVSSYQVARMGLMRDRGSRLPLGTVGRLVRQHRPHLTACPMPGVLLLVSRRSGHRVSRLGRCPDRCEAGTRPIGSDS